MSLDTYFVQKNNLSDDKLNSFPNDNDELNSFPDDDNELNSFPDKLNNFPDDELNSFPDDEKNQLSSSPDDDQLSVGYESDSNHSETFAIEEFDNLATFTSRDDDDPETVFSATPTTSNDHDSESVHLATHITSLASVEVNIKKSISK